MADDALTLLPRPRARGTLRLPGSKSLTNRALLLAALARGRTRLSHVLHSDDTRHMRVALEALGVVLAEDGEDLLVTGTGGPFDRGDADGPVELFLGNSGTSTRSLAAVLPAGRGDFILSGEPRLHERPIGDLVDALEQLGARVEYLHSRGYPPLRIRAAGLAGGTAHISGALSSQFVSGLLMAAPLADGDVHITVDGPLVSVPYIRMTLAVMAQFGVDVRHEDLRRFEIAGGSAYESPGHYVIEGDASGASYFLAAGAIGGGPVRVEGAGRDSLQGDVAFADVLEAMGARVSSGPDWIEVRGPEGDHPLRGVDMDLNHIPDAAMTLATTALFARGTTRIRNVYNWRLKETDRLAAMARELRKVGATVDEGEDSLTIRPPERLEAARIETYDDHRMAMCFALVAFGDQPVTLMDPACVNKTFPTFFDAFERVSSGA
jgi:3-phosphoshikimate 1-carboxyvinyltransferase